MTSLVTTGQDKAVILITLSSSLGEEAQEWLRHPI